LSARKDLTAIAPSLVTFFANKRCDFFLLDLNQKEGRRPEYHHQVKEDNA
jgi:hypothetical protein